jgi:hypothetical protein
VLLRDLKPLLDLAGPTSSACNVTSWVGEACAGKPWEKVGCSGPKSTGYVNSVNITTECINDMSSSTSTYELPSSLAQLTGLTRCDAVQAEKVRQRRQLLGCKTPIDWPTTPNSTCEMRASPKARARPGPCSLVIGGYSNTGSGDPFVGTLPAAWSRLRCGCCLERALLPLAIPHAESRAGGQNHASAVPPNYTLLPCARARVLRSLGPEKITRLRLVPGNNGGCLASLQHKQPSFPPSSYWAGPSLPVRPSEATQHVGTGAADLAERLVSVRALRLRLPEFRLQAAAAVTVCEAVLLAVGRLGRLAPAQALVAVAAAELTYDKSYA